MPFLVKWLLQVDLVFRFFLPFLWNSIIYCINFELLPAVISALFVAGIVHSNPGPRNHYCKGLYMHMWGSRANLQDVAVVFSNMTIFFSLQRFPFQASDMSMRF